MIDFLQQNHVFVPGYISLPFKFYYDGDENRIVEMNSLNSREFENLLHRLSGKRIFFIVTDDIRAVHNGENAIRWINSRAGYCGEHTGIHIYALEIRPMRQ